MIRRESSVGGSCSTESGSTVTLTTGFSETLDDSSGKVTLNAAGEESFLNYIKQASCRGQAPTPTPLALVPVATVTPVIIQTHQTVSLAFAASGPTLAPVRLIIHTAFLPIAHSISSWFEFLALYPMCFFILDRVTTLPTPNLPPLALCNLSRSKIARFQI